MQLSVLHSFLGDKEMDFDTETEEGRKKLGEVLNKLLRSGTAIFLERADKTLRVTGFDPATDKLIVQNPHADEPVGAAPSEDSASCACTRCRGCKNPIADRSRTGICTPCQQNKHGGEKLVRQRRHISVGTRRGRMTAVAPRAGG